MTLEPRELREMMRIYRLRAEDVTDFDATSEQGIGQETAMASPWHGLGAENGRRSRPRDLDQPCEPVRELARLHVIGVAAKSLDSPADVRRIRSWRPPPAELRNPRVR